jgi:phospholipid/cholesterol/gamma-HCH transport system permease protein
MAFGVYLRDVAHSMALRDVITGLVKSVAFATIIVHVGCLEGFRVRGGPDAVGRSATSAVVKSTFLVILADVGFTAIFYLTGGK